MNKKIEIRYRNKITGYFSLVLIIFFFSLLSAQSLSAATTWSDFRGNQQNNAVVDALIPDSASDAMLSWAIKAGDGFDSDAASSPILVDGDLVYTAGTSIVKVCSVTGEVLCSGTMTAKSAFNIIPPTYADGLIFVALSNGRIEAFDSDTLEEKWLFELIEGGASSYTDEDGNVIYAGQPNCPITYYNGKIYTGFWSGPKNDGSFVCIDALTGEKVWQYQQQGGFYWAGAYVCDDYLLVGADNGASDDGTTDAPLLCLNPVTGDLMGSVNAVGNIRSTVCYDTATQRGYFTSEGGYFYGVKVEVSGDTATLTKEIEVKLSGKSTSTPVVYNGRAYVGVCGTTQFNSYDGHNISVIDIESESVAYTCPTKGFPQTSGLLTTGYEADTGSIYVYFIDNKEPGKVRVIEDKPGQTALKAETEYAPVLFTPTGDHGQYAICSPICDEYGTLYFKNDSGYMFAVSSKITKLEVTANPDKTEYTEGEVFESDGMEVTATYANGATRDVTAYVTYSTEALTLDDFSFDLTFPYVCYQDTTGVEDADDTNDNDTTGITVTTPVTSIDLTIKEKSQDPDDPDDPEDPDEPVALTFTDVNQGDYYYNSVCWAVQKNITSGTSDTTFSPDEICTRGQIVTFLWRAAGSPVVITNNPFRDINYKNYFYQAVLWAVANGITSGTSDSSFSPYEYCTREQAVTFLWRFAGKPLVVGVNPFKDVSISDYSYEAILWAAYRDVTKGTTITTFSPDDTCTRGQIVTFMYRYLEDKI